MSLFSELQAKLGQVSDSQIFEAIKKADVWGSWLAMMTDPRRPPPKKKNLIEDWIDQRWNTLLRDLSNELVEVDGKMAVHRCIEVDDPEAYVERLVKSKKRIGIYWAWTFQAAECHWGTGTGTRIYLTGLVDLDAIDIKETVLSNFNPSTGEDENEIRLKEGAPVLLTNVSLSEEDPRWIFDPPIPLRA